jgi:hypothetical protein
MCPKIDALEKIYTALSVLRKESKTHRYPKELWEEIILLTNTHSVETICKHLKINPSYLKRKLRQLQAPPLDFQEISAPLSACVLIEISTPSGLTAKIQGPISCLSYLNALLGVN